MNRFSKYQALGNDMIVIDPSTFTHPLTPAGIQVLCRRHFGIGADGVCFGPTVTANDPPLSMRFYNPDGSEAEKSGNGLRIFARYLWDMGYVSGNSFQIHINKESIPVTVLDEHARRLALGMGNLSFASCDVHLTGRSREVIDEELITADGRWSITAVSVGNPHCIIFTDNLNQIEHIGPLLEAAPQFTQRTNVQLVRIIDSHTIRIAIWERGAGYTLASGTSATATAGAAIRHGHCLSPVTVIMDGGSAEVRVDETWQATLIGEVVSVYQGTISPELLQRMRSGI